MARMKKFSGGKKISDFEELYFELNDQRFNCYPAIQGAVFLDFVREADQDGGAAAGALYDFLEKAMPPAEYERFQGVLHDPEVIIDISTIGEIVTFLVEEYASRPTEEPAS